MLNQMKIINSGEFEVISTTSSLINRFKSESEKKTSTVQSTHKVQESTQKFKQKNAQPFPKSNNQKKSPTGLIVGAVILIILAVVFLFMK